MSRAIELDTELWRRLAARCEVSLESSIESFSPERLERLGKNFPLLSVPDVILMLARILETLDCKIVLGRIAIDPTLSIEEFIADCDGFRAVLRKFRSSVTVGGMLMNEFVPLFGTPSTVATAGENPWVAGELRDDRMRRLQGDLLSNDQFKAWCALAEDVPDYRERNVVFDEILRVARDRAFALAHASA